jgi:Outer membrane protein beta-barrel domain
MNKDLHDMDELFRSALEEYEETPSPGLKDGLIAALDKKDAGSYKKRFFAWKRTALLLLLLLSGIVLYESGILKTGGGRSDKKNNSSSLQKEEPVYQNNTATAKANNDKSEADEKVIINNSFDNADKTVADDDKIITQSEKEIRSPLIAGINSPEVVSNKNLLTNKATIGQKNNFLNGQANFFTVSAKKETSFLPSGSDKNNLLNNNSNLPEERINTLHRADGISFTKIISQLTNNIQQLLLPPAIDSLSKSGIAKNKKISAFKPFWMITPFASHERAGYKLDSDLPNNITSIKYREVHEPSFSIGLLATRQLTRHWGLQTGLIYSHTSIGISPQKMYALQNGGDVAYKYITSSGYAYIKPGFGTPPAVGDSLSTTEAKHTLQYVSVPAVIKYTIAKNKLSLTPGAGIEANFLASAKVETEIQDASNVETVTITKLIGAKPLYWSVVADAELRYSVNKKVLVNLRPTFRYAISPITKNNVVETFPHSFGIGAGLTIKF